MWGIVIFLCGVLVGGIIGIMFARHNYNIAKKIDQKVDDAVDAGVDKIKETLKK